MLFKFVFQSSPSVVPYHERNLLKPLPPNPDPILNVRLRGLISQHGILPENINKFLKFSGVNQILQSWESFPLCGPSIVHTKIPVNYFVYFLPRRKIRGDRWVLVKAEENAGVIDMGDGWVAFELNPIIIHLIEPFEGAATEWRNCSRCYRGRLHSSNSFDLEILMILI